MIFSNCKKILLSALIFNTLSPLLLYANETQVPQETLVQHNEILEDTLKAVLAQYNAIDLILQDLAIVVNNDLISNLKNKRALLEEVKNIRSIVEEAKGNSYATINPAHLALLIKILDDIVTHLGRELGKGLTSLAPFDLDACVKRAFSSEVDLNNLDRDIVQVRKKIDGLDQEARNAGLQWYNKIYRKVNDTVIQPSIRYSVPQRAGKVMLGAAILFAFWFNTDRGTPEEDLPKSAYERLPVEPGQKRFYGWEYSLRKLVMAYAHNHSEIKPYSDQDFHFGGKNPVGLIGITQLKMIEYAKGNIPLFAMLFGLAPAIYKDEVYGAYDWMVRKVQSAHNYMLGGAYRKLEVRTESMQLEPKITFDDLVGLDHAKRELSLIVEYIKDPERWDRSKLAFEKGFLLTGPTRTGKSYTAEALAGEIRRLLKSQGRNPEEFGFYTISASYIIQNGIAKLLDAAKREAPCVLFIDEIDLLGLQRTGNKDLLHELLQSMSGAFDNDPRKQVILLAATNKPENIEEALKQRGRFGVEIRYEYPNAKDRTIFLVKRLSNLVISLDAFDLDKIVRETEGCSFEDLNAMVKKAFQKSKISGHAITQESLENAIDTEIRHIIFDESKNLPESERDFLAIHQAGHAFACVMLKSDQELAKVTVKPYLPKLKEESPWDPFYKDVDDKQKTIEHGKTFTFHPHDTLNMCTKVEKINLIKMYLAGHIAEEIFLGSCGYSYHKDDKQHALQIAQSIVFEGIKVDKLPKKLQNDMYDAAFKLLNQCKDEVTQLLMAHKDKLQTIIDALKKKQILTAEEVKEIIQPGSSAANKKHETKRIVDAATVEKDLGMKEVKAPTAADLINPRTTETVQAQ